MHTLFAIEPTVVSNWNNLRYLSEKFGFSKGALIARLPKSWFRLVWDECRRQGIGGTELSRITERLDKIKKDRCVPLGVPFGSASWLENAQQVDVLEKVAAIIVNHNSDVEKHYQFSELGDEFFDGLKEVSVTRTLSCTGEILPMQWRLR